MLLNGFTFVWMVTGAGIGILPVIHASSSIENEYRCCPVFGRMCTG